MILVAGIGNIFLGDDAFGVEVVGELQRRALPREVTVIDFGIRSYDLAYAISEAWDAVVLVDAAPRGEPPGTVYLLEVNEDDLGEQEGLVDAHSMDPVRVLQLGARLGGRPKQLYVVGCEPASVDPENSEPGLSPAVKEAVPKAVEMIEKLVGKLSKTENKHRNRMPALAG